MKNDELGKQVASNVIWRLMERFGAQGVTFLVSIVLARLLDPAVYGLVAIVTVITTILQVFVDAGFSTALIQKKDADDLDFSSVFYFNILICCVLYALLFLAAPLIAKLYKFEELTPIIRVLGLIIVISGVKSVQHSYVAKNLLFKKFFFATLGGTIGAAVLGIWMAYLGYGVWALVAQHLFNTTVDTIILWITVKWRPKKMFSFTRLKSLFSYGWKLFVSELLNTIYKKLRQLLIGTMYSPEDLAFYNKGDSFPDLAVTNLNTAIDNVLLPIMSKEQDGPDRLKNMTRRAIKTSSYIMVPIMFGLAAVAEPMIRLLLTEKWLPCVFYMRIFCYVYLFQPIQTANLNAIKAIGRSDVFLKLEIIKKAIGLTALFSTIFISVKAMAISFLFTTVCNAFVNAFPNKKLLKYSFREQILDILPYLGMGAAVLAGAFSISLIGLPDWLTLLIQVPLGVVIYVGLSMIFKVDSFHYVLNVAKSMLNRRKTKNDPENEEVGQ